LDYFTVSRNDFLYFI